MFHVILHKWHVIDEHSMQAHHMHEKAHTNLPTTTSLMQRSSILAGLATASWCSFFLQCMWPSQFTANRGWFRAENTSNHLSKFYSWSQVVILCAKIMQDAIIIVNLWFSWGLWRPLLSLEIWGIQTLCGNKIAKTSSKITSYEQ